MGTIASLLIKLTAKTSVFDKKMKKSGKSVNSMQAQVKKLGTAMKVMAATGVAAMALLVRSHLKSLDSLAKLSQELDINANSLKALQHAATLAGSSAETLNNSLRKMSKAIGESNMGIGEAKDAFDKLGLSAIYLESIGTEQAFLEISDAISKLSTASEKATVAAKIFGRSGQELIVMFKEGRIGIEEVIEGYKLLGKSYSETDLRRIQDANDAFTVLRETFGKIVDEITIGLAPILKSVSDRMSDLARSSIVKWTVGLTAGFAALALGIMATLKVAKLLVAGFHLLMAHPVVLAIAAVTATLVLAARAMGAFEDSTASMAKELEALQKKHDKASDSLANMHSAHIKLLERLHEIVNVTGVSNATQKEANSIAKTLTETYGDLGISIDSVGNAGDVSVAAMVKLINAQKQMKLDKLNEELKDLDATWTKLTFQAARVRDAMSYMTKFTKTLGAWAVGTKSYQTVIREAFDEAKKAGTEFGKKLEEIIKLEASFSTAKGLSGMRLDPSKWKAIQKEITESTFTEVQKRKQAFLDQANAWRVVVKDQEQLAVVAAGKNAEQIFQARQEASKRIVAVELWLQKNINNIVNEGHKKRIDAIKAEFKERLKMFEEMKKRRAAIEQRKIDIQKPGLDAAKQLEKQIGEMKLKVERGLFFGKFDLGGLTAEDRIELFDLKNLGIARETIDKITALMARKNEWTETLKDIGRKKQGIEQLISLASGKLSPSDKAKQARAQFKEVLGDDIFARNKDLIDRLTKPATQETPGSQLSSMSDRWAAIQQDINKDSDIGQMTLDEIKKLKKELEKVNIEGVRIR